MFPLGRRLALACAGAAVVGAALSGCGGGGSKPVSLPSISPSPPPTPTASSTQTELDAVSAVVRRYYSLLNVPTSEQQADEIAALMTPDCHCRDVASAIRGAVAKRQHFFGKNTIVSLVPNLDGPNEADVVLTYQYSRSGVADADGRVISSGRAMKGITQDFRLVHQGGHWLITKILRVSAGQPA